MNAQREIQLAPPIQYALPLRVERWDNSNIMVRIVDANNTPICSLGNIVLAEAMVDGANDRLPRGEMV